MKRTFGRSNEMCNGGRSFIIGMWKRIYQKTRKVRKSGRKVTPKRNWLIKKESAQKYCKKS